MNLKFYINFKVKFSLFLIAIKLLYFIKTKNNICFLSLIKNLF